MIPLVLALASCGGPPEPPAPDAAPAPHPACACETDACLEEVAAEELGDACGCVTFDCPDGPVSACNRSACDLPE